MTLFKSSRLLLPLLFASIFGSVAFATTPPTQQCTLSDCPTYNNTTYGGQGGAGGNGGNGGSGGAGGSAIQGQQQGQLQGQIATGGKATGGSVKDSGNSASISGVLGSGNSTIAKGAVTVNPDIKVNPNISPTIDPTTTSSATIASGAVQTANEADNANAGTATLTQEYKQVRQVATAYAAPLTSSPGTCLGSASAGGQAPSFGFSFGFTHHDHTCEMLEDAQALLSDGHKKAACIRLTLGSEGKKNAEALRLAGDTCDVLPPPVIVTTAATITPEQLKSLMDELRDLRERQDRMTAHGVGIGK